MTYDKEQWRASVDNGQISPNRLAVIVPHQYDPDLEGPGMMHPEAAAAMGALLTQAEADGVTELSVKYSYRTIAKQWEKWRNYQAGGNLAAYPGTSNHGWAVAVDFTGLTPRALAWVKAHAGRYGFLADVSSENWHYTYQGGYVPEEPEMTDEQKAALKSLLAMQRGVFDFLDGSTPPDGADPARVKMFRALTRAASEPKAGAPGEHTHPAHTHRVSSQVTEPSI